MIQKIWGQEQFIIKDMPTYNRLMVTIIIIHQYSAWTNLEEPHHINKNKKQTSTGKTAINANKGETHKHNSISYFLKSILRIGNDINHAY